MDTTIVTVALAFGAGMLANEWATAVMDGYFKSRRGWKLRELFMNKRDDDLVDLKLVIEAIPRDQALEVMKAVAAVEARSTGAAAPEERMDQEPIKK